MPSSKSFFYAKNLNDVFYQLKTISDLTIVGGCTSFVGKDLPEKSLSIRDISELKVIDKHERYIDLGAALPLSDIEDLGETNLPRVFYNAIITIANKNIRNIATLGGNICTKDFYTTLYAPLLALDAKFEFQNGENSYFQAISRLNSMPEHYLLSRVRLPFEEWEVAVFRRLGPQNSLNELSAGFVFLANSQKNQISDLRIAFAGSFAFRDTSLENKLIGAHLPLSETAISNFLLEAEESFNEATKTERIAPILKKQFWNLVKYSLEQLT
ncbi:MAG: FAD binding domain-containing protein [Treponema sp.]|uniref:FAD binding domain-containing protein n=1 Tax=Treponema sp. TaxID=166 RepID=UPI001B67990A|nr:FAD binding domain-containing protein [Treponema sp.]MBP3773568.1 FAD binding domain-containing protein [Treponema sp.]MBQ9283002.1 FAD binding domain-containing protein [Treponema sp.]